MSISLVVRDAHAKSLSNMDTGWAFISGEDEAYLADLGTMVCIGSGVNCFRFEWVKGACAVSAQFNTVKSPLLLQIV